MSKLRHRSCEQGRKTVYCHYEKDLIQCSECWPCAECEPCCWCEEETCPYTRAVVKEVSDA